MYECLTNTRCQDGCMFMHGKFLCIMMLFNAAVSGYLLVAGRGGGTMMRSSRNKPAKIYHLLHSEPLPSQCAK